jgi:hypothetical protein
MVVMSSQLLCGAFVGTSTVVHRPFMNEPDDAARWGQYPPADAGCGALAADTRLMWARRWTRVQ